jgi:transcriptional regulator with XRE-family HTH domain
MKGGVPMTDSAALRQLVEDKGIRYKYLAKKLGITPYGLALKINNKNDFKISEVVTLCELLGITSLRERDRIFFAKNVEHDST